MANALSHSLILTAAAWVPSLTVFVEASRPTTRKVG
jgi:hypothetical protein